MPPHVVRTRRLVYLGLGSRPGRGVHGRAEPAVAEDPGPQPRAQRVGHAAATPDLPAIRGAVPGAGRCRAGRVFRQRLRQQRAWQREGGCAGRQRARREGAARGRRPEELPEGALAPVQLPELLPRPGARPVVARARHTADL